MIFGTTGQLQRMRDVKVKPDDVEIERVENYKYLGMKLDTRFTLAITSHISKVKHQQILSY